MFFANSTITAISVPSPGPFPRERCYAAGLRCRMRAGAAPMDAHFPIPDASETYYLLKTAMYCSIVICNLQIWTSKASNKMIFYAASLLSPSALHVILILCLEVGSMYSSKYSMSVNC